MLASLTLAAVAAVASFSSTVLAQGVCQQSPYNALTCLSTVAEAKSACKQLPKQTKTVTVTTTSLDVFTSSTTQMAASQNQVTVSTTSSQFQNVTVTKGPTSTITETSLSTYSGSGVLTTYVPCSSLDAIPVQAAEAATCDAAAALPALASITSNDTLATACSCLGHPVKTRTITETVNAPAVATTTTAVDGTPKTTTLIAITLVTGTETVAPVTTITSSGSTTVAAGSTVSLAAPTFTPVFGPSAGCELVESASSTALPTGIKSLRKAVKKCKKICEQDPECKSLYVQHMPEDSAYVCETRNKFLKRERDLVCKKDKSVYGLARGFDAKGRGMMIR